MDFQDIIFSIGVPATIAAFIYSGRKLQVLDDIKKTVEKIKTNVKITSDFLTKNHENFNSSELQTYSPLRLTQEGLGFIERIGFADAFVAHKDDFFAYIDSEHPKLKYDVEAASIKSIYALYDKDYMSFLKNYLYSNPKRNLANVAPTLGIYVREKYLAEHPNIAG